MRWHSGSELAAPSCWPKMIGNEVSAAPVGLATNIATKNNIRISTLPCRR
jgi:hypothetical protein